MARGRCGTHENQTSGTEWLTECILRSDVRRHLKGDTDPSKTAETGIGTAESLEREVGNETHIPNTPDGPMTTSMPSRNAAEIEPWLREEAFDSARS